MKYFLIRLASGDDNDQDIRHYIDIGENREKLLGRIESDFFRGFNGNRDSVFVDCDGECLAFLWYEYCDEDGNPKDAPDDDCDGICYHEDYFIEGEYGTEQEAKDALRNL